MKKLLILLLALLLIGCNFVESKTPTEITTTFLDSLKSMDFEKAKTVADEALRENISELETAVMRDESAQVMTKKLLSWFDYEILSEKITDESATVTLNIHGLSDAAFTQIGSDLMMAGFSVSDPTDTEDVSKAVLEAVETIDLQTLERVEREIELTLEKDGREWRLAQDTLTRLTDALLP